MPNESVLILGSGGHGWEALSGFISQYEGEINLFTLTVDYGGSGGIWYRLLEHNDFELNKSLHNGNLKPILPWGDLNKIFTHFFIKKFGQIGGQILDFRSNNLDEHLAEIDILGQLLAMEFSVEKSFIAYFKKAFDYFLEHKTELKYSTSREFCLGYVWQDFLHWNLEKVPELSLYYRQNGILPPNFKVHFTSNNRQLLVGKTEQGKVLRGEDLIDTSSTKILPESLKILEIDRQPAEFSQDFWEALDMTKTVVIPTGSITNWLPLINQKEIAEILKHKKLIWIVNPSTAKNEFEPQKYLDYLESKSLKPLLLGSQTNLAKSILVKVDSENKYLPKDLSSKLLQLLA